MAIPRSWALFPVHGDGEVWLDGELKAVIIPAMVSAFGVLMTQYIRDATLQLVESARVDGASFRVFWSVALPTARPAAPMLALFTFVGSWTNFLAVYRA